MRVRLEISADRNRRPCDFLDARGIENNTNIDSAHYITGADHQQQHVRRGLREVREHGRLRGQVLLRREDPVPGVDGHFGGTRGQELAVHILSFVRGAGHLSAEQLYRLPDDVVAKDSNARQRQQQSSGRRRSSARGKSDRRGKRHVKRSETFDSTPQFRRRNRSKRHNTHIILTRINNIFVTLFYLRFISPDQKIYDSTNDSLGKSRKIINPLHGLYDQHESI